MTDVLPAKLLWRTDPPCCNEERGAEFPRQRKFGFARFAKVHRRCRTSGYGLSAAQSWAKRLSLWACKQRHPLGHYRRRQLAGHCPGLLGAPMPKVSAATRPLV
jgi:hypothetical protein